MSRPERLFRLLQALRTLPAPVTAQQLSRETGVSVRSIYRDIESLRASGAEIGGERGYGYCLIEDGTLAPQAFNRLEIEALVLGLAEVRHMGDSALAQAAADALAKVAATLPSASQQQMLHAVSRVHRFNDRYGELPDMHLLREACWREEALSIRYTDKRGQATQRMIWPLAIVYLDRMLVVLSWCCMRQEFRKFMAGRITAVEPTGSSFRPRRAKLLREYLAALENGASVPINPPAP